MDTERRGKLRWRHILTLAGVGALAPLLMLGHNLGRDAYEKHRKARLEAKYEDGLWLCGSLDDMFDEYRRKAETPPDLLMLVIPPPPGRWEFVAISGNVVRVLESGRTSRPFFIPLPAPRLVGEDSAASNRRVASPEDFSVTLAPDLLSDVVKTVTDDIRNARAKPARGADGVSFLFFTASGQCGETWMPKEKTRAGKLVEVGMALRQAARSPEDVTREQAIERLRVALESLQE